MSSVVSRDSTNAAVALGEVANSRAHALADRLMQGAEALAGLANSLTDVEWQTRLPKEAKTVAGGTTIRGLIPADIDQMNANHAVEFDGATRQETVELLRRNSAAAATAIRQLTDEELDRAVLVSLYGARRSPVSSFLKITPFATVITISRASGPR